MMGDGPRTRLRRLACSRRASNTDLPVNMVSFSNSITYRS